MPNLVTKGIMSRIGNTPINIPDQVTVEVANGEVVVKGPKGQLTAPVLPGIEVEVQEDQVMVSRRNERQQVRSNHGLVRSLINNHIIGVTDGYSKTLKLIGTGYRVQSKGQGLSITVGLSHSVEVEPLEGVTLKTEGNDTIHVEGINKQVVGQMAADIRKLRPPEPYKGKGIRYEDEFVRIKPGKTVTGTEV